MTVCITGEPKEIADLVLAIQDQQNQRALETAAEELFQNAQSGDPDSVRTALDLING